MFFGAQTHRSQKIAASGLKSHLKNYQKTIPTEHGSDISRKFLEREQDFNIETLQRTAFWRLKHTVLENQTFQVQNRADVATCFFRSGASPAEVSEPEGNHRDPDPGALKNYQTRYRND